MTEPAGRRVAVVGEAGNALVAAVAAVLGRTDIVEAVRADGATVGRGYDLVVADAHAVAGRRCAARAGVLIVADASDSLAPVRDEDDRPLGSAAVVVPGAGSGRVDATGVRWFSGDARVDYYGPVGELHELELRLLRSLPVGVAAVPVRVEVDGRAALSAMLRPARPGEPAVLRLAVPVEGHGPLQPVEVRVRTGPGDDVPVAVARIGVGSPDVALRRTPPPPPPWWASWPSVVGASAVVVRWLAHAWQVRAELLVPPVDLPVEVDEPGERGVPTPPTILLPGPFGGVPYKQAELIGVFQVLAERARATGWELAVVGPVLDGGEPLAGRARRRAGEVPGVTFHLDPSPAEEAALIRRARLVWSAVGIGEDTVAEPSTTDPSVDPVVRAMAGGAVPIVVRGAAADGVVAHRHNGLVVPSLALLLAATEALAADEVTRSALGAEAAATAAALGPDGFARRVGELVAGAGASA